MPTPAIPRGHRHVGYCHGSCDRGVRGVDASGLLAAPAGQSKMPKSLLSSAGASPLPAGGGRCSGQDVPIALGSTGKPAPAGRAPPCHPGVPGSPLPSGAGRQMGGARRLPGAHMPSRLAGPSCLCPGRAGSVEAAATAPLAGKAGGLPGPCLPWHEPMAAQRVAAGLQA